MDAKFFNLINNMYVKFKQKTFDENDVLGFLLIVRESLPPKTALREICHVAMQRNKDKSNTCQLVKRVAEVALAVKPEFMDKVCSWYSEDVIRDEINKFFAMMKLEELPKDVTNDIILCIISILQCIPVFDRRGNEICRTTFFATAKEISLVVMMKSGEVSDPTITPMVMAKVIKLERESREFLNGVAEISTRKPYYIVREKGQLGIKKL